MPCTRIRNARKNDAAGRRGGGRRKEGRRDGREGNSARRHGEECAGGTHCQGHHSRRTRDYSVAARRDATRRAATRRDACWRSVCPALGGALSAPWERSESTCRLFRASRRRASKTAPRSSGFHLRGKLRGSDEGEGGGEERNKLHKMIPRCAESKSPLNDKRRILHRLNS